MKTSRLALPLTLGIFWVCSAYAAASGEGYLDFPDGVLGEISIVGNTRTLDKVVLREIEIPIGSLLDQERLAESRRRLNNLRIFSTVEFSFEINSDGGVRLVVHVDEQWTAIPIAKIGSAGGTNFFTVGAFDSNFLGRYLEIGAQYENLNGRDGGVTWFRNPRLFDQRLRFGYDIWFTTQNREFFDDEGNRESAFTFAKTRAHFFIAKEIVNWFVIGGGIDYSRQETSDRGLSGRQRRRNLDSNFSLPASSERLAVELTARIGRLNFDGFLVEGVQSDWLYQLAVGGVASTETSSQLTVQNRAFLKLFGNHNLGVNLSLGQTTANLLQDQFYLGGLNDVRGFRDGQFVGSHFWRANVEYRLPSWESSWLVVQNVAFVDFGNAGGSFSAAFENKVFSGLGTGLRLIFPKIFRLNVRIDYAQTFGRDAGGAFSFGLQQFF